MTKTLLLFPAVWMFVGAVQAQPRELAVPRKWGLYVAGVSKGRVKALGDYNDWKASPDGRFVVVGREIGSQSTFYEVNILSPSTSKVRRLERFRVEPPFGAEFRWSSDSQNVRVEADRDGDDKSESKTFVVAHASVALHPKKPVLSSSTLKKLKARFPNTPYDVAFSLDGERVVAYLGRGDYSQKNFDGGYWTFRPDGSDLQRLTRNTFWKRGDFQDREIVWLDGKRLAFRRTSFEDEGT